MTRSGRREGILYTFRNRLNVGTCRLNETADNPNILQLGLKTSGGKRSEFFSGLFSRFVLCWGLDCRVRCVCVAANQSESKQVMFTQFLKLLTLWLRLIELIWCLLVVVAPNLTKSLSTANTLFSLRPTKCKQRALHLLMCSDKDQLCMWVCRCATFTNRQNASDCILFPRWLTSAWRFISNSSKRYPQVWR